MGSKEEVKVESKDAVQEGPSLADLMAKMSALMERTESLESQLAEEKAKNKREEKAYVAGKQPIDEMIGHRRREPVITKLPNGTKRTDY